MSKSISITFARGARRVTGSNFLVEAKDGDKSTKVLIDCGLSQGEKFCESPNAEPFSYDPKTVTAIIFTHAHADHIGLFPKLVKEGFQGKAYATEPTRDLMPIMLEDSVGLISDESKKCGYEAPYSREDVEKATHMVEGVAYKTPIALAEGISATLYNAGHILGSATVLLDIFGTKVLFTGDLGRSPAVIVPERDIPSDVDYLITESVYGNRVHPKIADSETLLNQTVEKVRAEKGVLLIPAFSLERTQIILSILDALSAKQEIPQVFMDSPLSAKVTKVYEKYPAFLKGDLQDRLRSGDAPFSFPSLHITADKEASQSIDHAQTPKIIIAGAGMSHGGRIRHHEMRYLPQATTTLMVVGYQVPGSLGRRLRDGAKEVSIDGVTVPVKAQVVTADGFSAHADREDIMSFVEAVSPKRVFVVLGETEGATFLAQRISGFLNIPVDVPREGETYDIPLV